MIQYLQNMGNSIGIIVKKPLREVLGWDKKTPLDIQLKGNSLIITAASDTEK